MGWIATHRIALKYAALALVLGATVVWLERAGVLSRWAAAVDPAIEALAGFGVVGAFLLGLLGNSSILLQVPYVVPLLSAALAGASSVYLLALAVAAGVGATAGELVSYTVADLLLRRRDLGGSGLYRWVRRTVDERPRWIPWLVLVFALTFLPDDVLLVALAMVGYGVPRIVLPLLVGKLGYTVGCAVLFRALGDVAGGLVSPHATADIAVVLLVLLVLLVLYQVEAARAASVEPRTPEEDDDGAHPHRHTGGLRPGHDDRGRGGGHEAHRRPRR